MAWQRSTTLLCSTIAVSADPEVLLPKRSRRWQDAVAFIGALGFDKVDLFGFSLGGFVSQVIAQQQPGLVRKIILAGTGPAGGDGIVNVGAVLQDAFGKAAELGEAPDLDMGAVEAFFTDRDAPATRR